MTVPSRHRFHQQLRIGYLPLVDAAPLLVARDEGYFGREGLEVSLLQQPGWATIQDKLASGELDAAHCLAGLLFAPMSGLPAAGPPTTGLCLNTHGNTITLSKNLWERGIRDGAKLAAAAKQGTIRVPLVFGAVHPLSSHIVLLRSWLTRLGLKCGEHYQVVYLPPNLMPPALVQGHLDGYCAGEPWGSAAALSGEGFIIAASDEIFPHHLEKVLAVRADFARERPDLVLALNRAVLAGCQRCDEAGFRPELAGLLAGRGNLGVAREWVMNSLAGTMQLGFGRTRPVADLHVFHGEEVNRPDLLRFTWLKQELARIGHLPDAGNLDVRRHILDPVVPPQPAAAPPKSKTSSTRKSHVQRAC